MSMTLSSSQLTLPSPRVLKSILYVCVFISVLPLGSSEPFFFFLPIVFKMLIPRSFPQEVDSVGRAREFEFLTHVR